MTNEEFQRIVLEELKNLNGKVDGLEQGQGNLEQGQMKLEERQKNLEQGQMRLEERQRNLEQGQMKLEERQRNLEQGQEKIEKGLKAVIEQTADLTEFRDETNKKLDTLMEENDIIKEINGRHEVDIRRLKRNII